MLEISFQPFPVLQTKRLLLRQVQQTDVKEMLFMRSDAEVMRYIDREPAKTTADAAEHIRKLNELEKNNEAINWAITLNGDSKLIGTICIWHIRKEHFRSEVGYALHPAHHRKGIMQEALTAVLEYGFNMMKLHSIDAVVNPENAASIKLLEKNNFVREAYFREDYFFNGKFLDTAIYSLLSPIK